MRELQARVPLPHNESSLMRLWSSRMGTPSLSSAISRHSTWQEQVGGFSLVIGSFNQLKSTLFTWRLRAGHLNAVRIVTNIHCEVTSTSLTWEAPGIKMGQRSWNRLHIPAQKAWVVNGSSTAQIFPLFEREYPWNSEQEAVSRLVSHLL